MASSSANDNNDDNSDFGAIHYLGLSKESTHCGYCKSNRRPGNTYGLWAYYLTPQIYQWLIDRNWRRCGKYVYKPVNNEICCPMYTIRCDAFNFQITNSQKKVIKNFNNFIKFGSKPNKRSHIETQTMDIDMERSQIKAVDFESVEKIDKVSIDKIVNSKEKIKENSLSLSIEEKNKNDGKVIDTKGDSSSSLKNTKKKFFRRQKLIKKVMKRENCSEDQARSILFEKSRSKQKTKTLEDFLNEVNDFSGAKHSFKTKIIQAKNISENSDLSDFQVFKKYQMTIHKEDESEISYHSYERFLLNSPLGYVPFGKKVSSVDGLPQQYGAYHQYYYIDDRLVAIGVIDILPGCISSVYLFYDPEYSFLNLGVYSALNEIALVRKLGQSLPNLRYYYMGFYIHQCPKMRYKAKYYPSDLLCSETFLWFDSKSCIEKLKEKKYARFCDDETVIDEFGRDIESCHIKVMYRSVVFTYRDFVNKTKIRSHEEAIYEFARLVGRKCVSSLLYLLGR